MSDNFEITNLEQLVEVIGEPHAMIKKKVIRELDEPMLEFISRSPLAFLATADERGQFDVSPKGDGPGFVAIESARELLLPDRPGNKLAFGFRNILANKRIGLIFMVPGMRETLRIKGTASITRDPALLQRLAVAGKPAVLCTRIAIEECFFHCGKAMIRSGVWKPESWGDSKESLLVRQIVTNMEADEATAELIESELEKNYRETLY